MKRYSKYLVPVMILVSCTLHNCLAQDTARGINMLLEGFLSPPNEAKPRVWWHWMNGNITKDGIRKDLEWMNRIGIGGFQNFDANLLTPQIVERRLSFMTPEWKEAFRFTAKLADSLSLEMAIAGSPGWSESGGPWVPASDGMKKYVWTETRIEGGKSFTGKLPKPASTTGTFQNAPLEESLSSAFLPKPPEYYDDVAVIAYKVPESDIAITDLNPKVTSSGGTFDLAKLTDGDLAESMYLPPVEVGQNAWVQFEFNQPLTIKSLNIVGGGQVSQFPIGPTEETRTLEISDDGKNFKRVMALPLGRVAQKTFTFAPITARFYRFDFKTIAPRPNPILALFGLPKRPPEVKGIKIAEIVLRTTTSINSFEEKAAFATATDLYQKPTPVASDPILIANVIDLTLKMNPDGSLDWAPPAGDWVVLRFGYSLTGRRNHPASPEATGLEVDKLNPTAVKAYLENYLDQYKDATGGLMGDQGGLKYIITDSWEAGTQNWTNNMMEEFANRHGYSMVPWMPVLTGRIVQSSEESDRFLWDFRKTLAEMVKEYHYDVFTEVLHLRGMGRYTESHENGRAFIGDGMAVKSTADIPMSAMWTPGGFGSESTGIAVRHEADIRESASVAHVYGQNLVAAESMTAIGNTWAFSPERLKPTADLELANGLNRYVIHTSVHQPVDDKIPGLGLGPFGQWFTRHETWAEQAKSWITYLARSSYMLQQGKFVADIVYFYGEDNNITALFGEKLPPVPEGYNYDFINADAIVELLSVEDGKIVTPSGMSYCLLALDENSRFMSMPVLRKIRELVNAGAIIAGPKPIVSPSLSDNVDAFKSIVSEIWESGRKNVFTGKSLGEALRSLGIVPDFQYSKPRDDTELRFVHRRLKSQEFYWVNNRSNRFENIEAKFRIDGKSVEIWHPETGKVEQASYKIENNRTTVPLRLVPNDAVFVVFSRKAAATSRTIPQPIKKLLTTLDGTWEVGFQANRGAPSTVTLEKLTSWSEHTEDGVKYFSGTGTYTKIIQAPADWFNSDEELWLDLGDVKNLAEVILNGQSLGIVWKQPFRADVSDALQAGDNRLAVKVTNLWVNRLIGDQQPNASQKYTYTTMPFYGADSPLLPSGLLGPVSIYSSKR